MSAPRRASCLLLVLAWTMGCSDATPSPPLGADAAADAASRTSDGRLDGRPTIDAGIPDAAPAPRDAGIDDTASTRDAGEPLPVSCDGCEARVRFVKLESGGGHTCAITSDAELVCWGSSTFGELGVGEALYEECPAYNPPWVACRNRPTLVEGLAGVVDVGVGSQHTCAVLEDGSVHCWGGNRSGQLGIPDEDLAYCEQWSLDPGFCNHRPRQVPGVEDAVAIAAGSQHNCVLRADGSVACWGHPSGVGAGAGAVPDLCGTEAIYPCFRRPIEQPIEGRVLQLSAGGARSAALLDGGRAVLWGTGPATPVAIDDIQTIHPNDHTCAIPSDGQVLCWGTNQFGQLGYGCSTMNCNGDPVAVEGFGEFRQFVTGDVFSCAVSPEGAITCIGLYPGAYAVVGDYCAPCDDPPCEVCNSPTTIFPPSDVAHLTLGNGFLCVLQSDGDFWCAGSNAHGRLGIGLEAGGSDILRTRCPLGTADCDGIAVNGCEAPVETCSGAARGATP